MAKQSTPGSCTLLQLVLAGGTVGPPTRMITEDILQNHSGQYNYITLTLYHVFLQVV